MKYLLISLIWLYQKLISPIFYILGVRCRFYPTCSQYSMEAFQKHGFLKGFWLSIRRVSRCHPWGGSGVDEVPK
ncbi:MAG: membrane protein insertion efficiency factor YidD [Candidatus Paceibacterota bacterium]